MVQTIRRGKKNWIGHVLRGEELMKHVIEGRIEGERIRKPETEYA